VRPHPNALLVTTIGGCAHLGVVGFLFRWLGHVPDSLWPLASIASAVFAFAFSFLVVLLSVHTRLLSPAVGLPTLLVWTTYQDVSLADVGVVGGRWVPRRLDGFVYLTSYVGTWYVWLAMLVIVVGLTPDDVVSV